MTSNQQDGLIGKTIDGYLIETLLGQGGMARVYRGLDINLQRYAAIKVIDQSSHNAKQYAERFDREARAIAKLSHPNIVSVYRFNEVNKIYYMAMEYIDGADLRWVIQDYQLDGDFMDYDTMIQIMQQVSDALDYAHRNGVIHRDIKPSNIMISRDGRAILTDFGLALDVTEGTQGEIFGSPHYIAPEQALDSKTVKPQTDIYSLGVILYEILVGNVPYYEGTTFEVAMKHINEPLPDPHEINPDLHASFIPILKKVMAKKIEDRYITGKALVKDLRMAVATARNANKIPQLDTSSRPEDRIAVKVLPLPPAPSVINQPTKPPTLLADIARQETLEDEKPNKPRRSILPTLIGIILLLVLTVGGYGALSYYDFLDIPFLGNAASAPTSVIEGRISNVNGRTLHIYDMPVLLNANEPILDMNLQNHLVRIEGRYTMSGETIEFTQITSILLDNEPLDDE